MSKLSIKSKQYQSYKYIVHMCVALNKPTAPDIDVYDYMNISVISTVEDSYTALIEAAKYICNIHPNAKIDWVDTNIAEVIALDTTDHRILSAVESVYTWPQYERRVR